MEYKQSNFQIVPMADRDDNDSEAPSPGISVSKFDYSVENHFKAMDKIVMLSGESEFEDEQTEIQRLSSSVTFLREWRDFCYQPQAIRFACESVTPQENDVIAQMNLPQFSSAAVPKDMPEGKRVSSPLSKDFVMYVGGLVWALDWCPRVHQSSDFDINVEFVAVAAHPPESSYHKIGAPLTGRGLIQIWCLLNVGVEDQDVIPCVKKKPRKYSRNNEATKLKANQTNRPRGRPRKNPVNESVDYKQYMQALAVQFPEDPNKLLHTDGISWDTPEQVAKEETDGNFKSCEPNKTTKEMSKSFPETLEKVPKEGTCRERNTQQKSYRGTESINLNLVKPLKPTESLKNKKIRDSGVNFGSNQYLKPISGLFKPLSVDGSSMETPVTVSTTDECSNQNNTRPGVSTELPQQNPNDLESCNPWKPRGRPIRNPLKKSVDNFDDSNKYLAPLPVEFLEDSSQTDKVFLEIPEKVVGEYTCRILNAPGKGLSTRERLNPRGTETISCNPSKLETPKRRLRKGTEESINNLDGGNLFVQPLAVEFPEHSSKLLAVDKISLETPEIVAKEDNCINYNGLGVGVSSEHQQQNANGSDAKILKLSEPWKPRKKPSEQAVDNTDCSDQLTKDHSKILPENGNSSKTNEGVTIRMYSRKRKDYDKGYSEKSVCTASKSRLTKCQTRINGQVNGVDLPFLSQICGASLQHDPLRSSANIATSFLSETVPSSCSSSEDVALPRLVLGLAHNGKVAWDVKWRPSDSHAISKHRMGYLAVLLGNGALEVWEVPLLRATKAIFSSCQKEGTDPRFIKLKPVFKCSMLKCGDRRRFGAVRLLRRPTFLPCIPLTLEWSASAPHDLILAGCHDGVVALWKFSDNGPPKDTRPLLCFSADAVPIRALAWAPVASDPESANIVVTAGHKGVKFWDIRDPFRPLWDLPSPRIINSLDWLPDPRCVVFSSDDGEIRILSLLKAACDVPVTGIPFVATQLHGLHSYQCSSLSIWSVQVSKLTGMVAYCCSDGKVIRFQLTNKAVDKDPYRNREPHYLCGSLTEEESTLTVFSPLPDAPFPLKKSSNEVGDTPRSRRAFLAISRQEKRAKEQIANCQTPQKLSSGPCHNLDSKGTLVVAPDSNTSKANSNNKKNSKTKTGQALVCIEEVAQNDTSKEKNVKGEKKEVFPPKLIAMHRVRWNMNKGSERWLCYGGAGGIVRCQEISLSRR